MIERICRTGKVLAWIGTLKGGKQMRVVTVFLYNIVSGQLALSLSINNNNNTPLGMKYQWALKK